MPSYIALAVEERAEGEMYAAAKLGRNKLVCHEFLAITLPLVLTSSLVCMQTLATALQSRVSEMLHVDIHPAAKFGEGVLIDHATGVVIGETAVVGNNVSMLHHVTLGGSGTGKGARHPTIGQSSASADSCSHFCYTMPPATITVWTSQRLI